MAQNSSANSINTTQITMNPILATIANVKDSRWLTLEVCREFQRGKCTRSDQECKFAHPPPHVEVNNGKVVACFDSLKGRCQRTNPPCKYLHPPQHLKDVLLQNGRNNLLLKSLAMNIASSPVYAAPALAPYPNGATILQPSALSSTPLAYTPAQGPPAGATAVIINPYGIPAMSPAGFAPEGAFLHPVLSGFAGQKAPRSDRLEVCPEYQQGSCPHSADTCNFAHPPIHCPVDSEGLVTVCVDYVKGKCTRETCKYFHPPDHLVQQLKSQKPGLSATAGQGTYLSAFTALATPASHTIFTQPLISAGSILPLTAQLQPNPSDEASTSFCGQHAYIEGDHPQTLRMTSLPAAHFTQPPQSIFIYPRGTTVVPTAVGPTIAENKQQEFSSVNSSQSQISDSNSGQRFLVYAMNPVESAVIIGTNEIESSSVLMEVSKKRPYEEDYLMQQPLVGSPAQFIAAPKRPAITDPKTGIPMFHLAAPFSAYPTTAFHLQPHYINLPVNLGGYANAIPRL